MSFGLHPLYLYKLTSSVLTTKMKAYGRACGLFLVLFQLYSWYLKECLAYRYSQMDGWMDDG